MPSVSSEKIEKLLEWIKPKKEEDGGDSEKITVHAAVSRFAVFYEKIRNAVEYRDEHLLRKAALQRMLKRQISVQGNPQVISLQLLKELVAARYLPNKTVPESMVPRVAQVIEKYQLVARERAGNSRHEDWLLHIIGVEIEEVLDTRRAERGFAFFLYDSLAEKIIVKGANMDDAERRRQIYIACLRMFLKADEDIVAYKLVRTYHSLWMRPEEWRERSREMAYQMVGIEQEVRRQSKHPLAQKFLQAVKPTAVALRMLFEAIKADPAKAEERLKNFKELAQVIEHVSKERLEKSRGALRRGTIRAIIYLFITKILFALAIEVPFEQFLYQHIDHRALGINVAFPPVLMMLVGLMIGSPSEENVKKIQEIAEKLISEEGVEPRSIKVPKTRTFWGRMGLRLVYVLMFGITFGLIILGLKFLHYTPLSSMIFLFFLCVVSFFAFRLRLNAREYVVVEKPERFTSALMDFFAYPILRAGLWLSLSISKINIFIFFFDVLIEAPFKIFLNALETWFAFMRERKEELE